MTRREATAWSWSAIAFVVVMAALGALVQRYTLHLAERVERATGYVPDPDGTRAFLSQLDQPTFRQAGAEAIAQAKGVDTFLHRYADKAHRAVYGTPYGPWDQKNVGSCVSFGWGMGSYVGQSVDWATGKVPSPPLLVATEPIYAGSRTWGRQPPIAFAGWSDGAYGGAAARWVSGLKNGVGGILYREKYGEVDLSTYDTNRCKQWGAYGVPESLAREANKHTAHSVALVQTWDGLAAAIESGFPVPICSNVGFASTSVRDADGFLPRGGSWGHCMVVIGIRHRKNGSPRDGALIMNSWGSSWVSGPKWPADQPDGSFWADRAAIEAILAQGDSFAIGGVGGFTYRDLHHGEWLAPQPVSQLARPQPAALISGIFSLSQ